MNEGNLQHGQDSLNRERISWLILLLLMMKNKYSDFLS